MNVEPMKNAARQTRHHPTPENAVCLLCARALPKQVRRLTVASLIAAIAGTDPPDTVRGTLRAQLDAHHLLGREIAPDLTIPLCPSCHVGMHDLLRDRGIDFRSDASWSLLQVLESVLRILALLHAELAKVLSALADRLAALIRALDASAPAWRELPEAAQ